MNNGADMKVVIIDDEKHGRDTIKHLLKKHFSEIEIAGEADNVENAITVIENTGPDVIFLDIELTDGTGFDVLDAFDEISFEIIFATAYNYYAIKAIKFSALDYLLKPVEQEEFISSIEKAKEKLKSGADKKDNINFLKEQIERSVPDKIALPSESGFTFIKIDNIIRCRAESNYTKFILAGGKPVVVSRTLKEYEELFKDYDFFRVHNSHLVNMAHVRKYLKGKTPRIVMSDGSEVDISSRKKTEFLKQFARL